ncbi:MAG: 23S rRNA (adenine(2503)-C(2))-methyltransferase RlmN [Bdellovibrionales bacterium]
MAINAHSTAFAPPTASADGRVELLGLSKEELTTELTKLGLEPFRAKQVWNWIYQHGARDFEVMSSLNKPTREKLAEHFTILRPTVSRAQKSEDGTQKWLLGMSDKQQVECVHIPDPDEDRGALCVSSQVGCTLTCRFCHTGTQKLVRNLSAAEILAQVMHTRDALNEWPSSEDKPNGRERLFTNIVMMGMGEPLYNYDNVAKALKIVMEEDGIAISKRRITLSTSGVVPMIEKCGAELGVNLAISLHAVTDELRDKIMPINRKYPLEQLMNACRNYPGLSNARRITFEYVMLKDVNDTDADAHELVRLIGDIPAKINLIPFNPWPGAPFERSSNNRIHRFGDIVNAAGYASPIRTPRGEDIMAACGQLKSDSVRETAAQRLLMQAEMQKIIAEKEAAVGS